MDQVLDQAALPVRLAGVGHCFRTEAGAGGTASRGLYRLHQFTKVELVVLSRPQDSPAMLEELLRFERQLYRDLGLCFRELDMPPADLGAPAARKIDMEAWMPGLERWGEISSASNCTDYQARRLGIRFRPDDSHGRGAHGKRAPAQFVHTLNATAAAVPRLVLALLENGQRADGGVDLPDVLAPYMGGQVRLDKRGE
ncbi:hypothetical protein H632_c4533p0 [Helicosporidium sp. ATCC 50920]|nr:hypothetical protein H632_c4533p0 [Helicosporidium sp. ATCC 50920]|eukprot:KDD71701.1 hypothetical protein H632_c4533p0 [Helicosporidium sp. ATCC 50920]